MQTRRYSSVLAVYHRVGGGRAIPVAGTRHAGSGMALGVSGRVADMPPPTAGYRPPDTANPGRAESGADFSGVLAALRARTRRADGPTLAESVQPPLQPSVQGGLTGTHTRVRTTTHIATHTATGTGERDQERGDGGSPREVQRCRRQRRKRLLEGVGPPYSRTGYANTGVARPHRVSGTRSRGENCVSDTRR